MIDRFLFVLVATVFLIIPGCADSSSDDEPATPDSTQTTQPKHWAETYTNAKYDISLRLPDNWILLEEPNLKPAMGTFAINLFKQGTGAAKEAPLHVHAKAKHSYVAVWPQGIGTELPAGQRVPFSEVETLPDFKFAINNTKSKVLKLKDGTAWAWFIQPENLPEKWTKHGFIFAQIAASNTSATCYDEQTNEQIPMDRCDYLAGDRYVREGDINQNDAETVRQILESVTLDSMNKKTKPADLIEIEKPLPNMDVSSPLTVKGKARGPWYFEGSFRIELVDAANNTLAETQAKAQGKWMTEDFVPFEATLEFDAPDDERGQLIFYRANPSGLAENAMQWSQPVIFPPK